MKKENLFKSIFKNCDTDKADNYSDAYENAFLSIRENIKLVFEIGVCRGGSVHGFRDYFPNALIVGIEIDQQYFFDNEDRIKIEIGDATDKNFISSLIQRYGYPDIVIDDGSHFSKDIKMSFDLLYPHVRTCYVIEDYGTQFPGFWNGFYINDGVPATSIIHKKTDELLSQKNICKSIMIYHSIAFIFV
jgi:hypothetical protein